MILERIELTSFRNYSKRVFNISSSITLITGVNGSGKTNILESIYLTASGKSFRAESDQEMINWDSEFSRIKVEASGLILEMLLTRGEFQGQKTATKSFKVNGVARRGLDFIGQIHAVIFHPEDLDLVTDSPSLRRRYLDRVLVQVDREYRRTLLSYERGLRQRNKLLGAINEGTANRSQLLFWDQLLIKTGGYITDMRQKYLNFVNKSKFEHMSFQVEYDKSVISEARLMQYTEEEVAANVTLVGPHRDDFIINKSKFQIPNINIQTKSKIENNNDQKVTQDFLDLSKYGSRGEQRLGVLWLKLSELQFIQEMTNDRPVLLLDDIFSELDDKHRKYVLTLMKDYQTIFTTAEDDVPELLKESGLPYSTINLNGNIS